MLILLPLHSPSKLSTLHSLFSLLSKLGIRNSALKTQHSKLSTQNSVCYTLCSLFSQNSKLGTRNSELSTQNSVCCTLCSLFSQNSELGTRNSELKDSALSTLHSALSKASTPKLPQRGYPGFP
uniref:Uncharacterized protein n=1 Tax=Desertifilum tharense IPPAS B-1220 TaxID=1781255 RepID=A0ACD5GSB5_9CYAN